MRMRLIEHSDRHVTLHYDCPWGGERTVRTFWTPVATMAYVREDVPEGDRQVCNALSSRGYTLTQHHGERLATIIRREYRAMLREVRKESRYV